MENHFEPGERFVYTGLPYKDKVGVVRCQLLGRRPPGIYLVTFEADRGAVIFVKHMKKIVSDRLIRLVKEEKTNG